MFPAVLTKSFVLALTLFIGEPSRVAIEILPWQPRFEEASVYCDMEPPIDEFATEPVDYSRDRDLGTPPPAPTSAGGS